MNMSPSPNLASLNASFVRIAKRAGLGAARRSTRKRGHYAPGS
ncbi:hypothetical protein [Pelomonas cellulosilytica]|nr:hypothetical protein [Pelomonas sp. P8]